MSLTAGCATLAAEPIPAVNADGATATQALDAADLGGIANWVDVVDGVVRIGVAEEHFDERAEEVREVVEAVLPDVAIELIADNEVTVPA